MNVTRAQANRLLEAYLQEPFYHQAFQWVFPYFLGDDDLLTTWEAVSAKHPDLKLTKWLQWIQKVKVTFLDIYPA